MFGAMILCYGEELTVHIIYMLDIFGDKDKLHHQQLMQTVLGLVVSNWQVPPPVLVHGYIQRV